jgi:hypothetical protein
MLEVVVYDCGCVNHLSHRNYTAYLCASLYVNDNTHVYTSIGHY